MYLLLILIVLIVHIDSCPLTDEYLSRCHCGILTNGESYIKCDAQSLNQMPIFKRSFPYDELILSNNNIEQLSRTALEHIRTIRRINLEDNSLSFIDPDLLRLLGNYLEELILTGDHQINSLEFLTRYPLKKLRVLKLNRFDLSEINLEKILSNMTKLEIVYLRSCQIRTLPNLSQIQIFDLEDNQISNSIILSTNYNQINLVNNQISSIYLKDNPKLEKLNLSKNSLTRFQIDSQTNLNLKQLDLSSNSLTSFDLSILNDNLIDLNLNSNHLLSINFNRISSNLQILSLNNNLIKQIKFPTKVSSLSSLDLNSNQLKTIDKNALFERLTFLNLQNNPLECDCHLEWLKALLPLKTQWNASSWSCQSSQSFVSSDFQCKTIVIPRILTLNISFIRISSENGLFIRWSIFDEQNILDSIQISISEPFYLTPKLSPNQTEVFLSNSIESNKKYHICVILLHKYARDKYCREFHTDQSISSPTTKFNDGFDMNLYMLLIGTCIGGLVTFLLLFTCCYLCYQIRKYNLKKKTHEQVNPIYHSSYSTTCPYHHHENLSNSTDSSQMDASFKHIYQTIDSQDYRNFQQRDAQLFHLWNESLRQKR